MIESKLQLNDIVNKISLLFKRDNPSLIELENLFNDIPEQWYFLFFSKIKNIFDYSSADFFKIFLSSSRKNDNHYLTFALCFHPNGFVRELALKQLERYEHKYVITIFLIASTTDCYEGNREFACNFLESHIRLDDINIFISNLGVLEKIKYKKNWKENSIYIKIDRFLRDNAQEQLIDALASKNPHRSYYAFELIIQKNDSLRARAFMMLDKVKNPKVIVGALKLLKDYYTPEVIKEKFHYFVQSKLSLVRKYSLSVLLEDIAYDNRLDLSVFLFDNSKSIRSLAEFYINKFYGRKKIRELYLNRISAGDSHLNYAILGLGHYGEIDDAAIIDCYMYDSDPAIQSSCLNAMLQLCPDLALDIALRFVMPLNPKVTKAVYLILEKIASINILNQYNLPLNSLDQLKLKYIKTKGRWARLAFLLDEIYKENNCEKDTVFLLIKLSKWIELESSTAVYNRPDSVECGRLVVICKYLLKRPGFANDKHCIRLFSKIISVMVDF